MSASTGVRSCLNMKRTLFLPLMVLLVTRVSFNDAQPEIPGLADASWFYETVKTLYPANIVKQLSHARLNDLSSGTSTKCSKQVTLLLDGLMKDDLWALKMIDSSSKIPSGIVAGNQRDLGMYDECVAINVVKGDEEIRGRHCMYNVSAGMRGSQFTETLSICIPAICEYDDIGKVLNSTFKMIKNLVDTDASVSGVTCSSVDPSEWTTGGIVTLVGFGALLLLLIVCTICDIFLMFSSDNSKSSSRLAVIRQFSFYANARRILSTKTSFQTLPALQGLRFFSMCWVILGHEYFMHILTPAVNLLDMKEWVFSWQSLYIMVAPFSVDTFFTISGFLLSNLFLKDMSTGRRFNILGYYIHRYLRLTPAYASLILITIFILPRMGSGAIWESTIRAEENICRENWWSMLLYIHNYVNKGCLLHTWYLAVEMQYFWLSPIILYPLARKPKIGLIILAACFVASVVTPVIITYDNKYSSALFRGDESGIPFDMVLNFYIASHNRAGPWLIGVFFGYWHFTQKEPSRKATKWIGWLLTIVAFAFCVFGTRTFQERGYVYNAVWETFFVAVARPSWAAAVSWIIYTCVRGFGGPITTILSFSIFHPLSRLSYCMYLVHYVVLLAKASAIRMPRFFTNFAAFDYFLSDLMLSIVIAFFFSLVFESPILVLEKLVRKPKETDASTKRLINEEVENGTDDPVLSVNQ